MQNISENSTVQSQNNVRQGRFVSVEDQVVSAAMCSGPGGCHGGGSCTG